MRAGSRKQSRKSLWIAAAAVAATQAPGSAQAAGTDIPDNGASIISRGGTYSSMLDSAYALQFNPAGMTRVNGLDVRIDYRWVWHDVSFKRQKSQFINGDFETVHNGATPFGSPGGAIVYRHPTGPLSKFALGIGAWGPSGIGRYSFVDPKTVAQEFAQKNSKNPEDPNYNPTYDDDLNDAMATQAGQRYSQIKSNQLIMYPSFGVAWQPHQKFSVGVTVQAVFASIEFQQALSATNALPEQSGENPKYDAGVKLRTTQHAFSGSRPTAIIGATFEPMKGLIINASFRPKVYIEAKGDVIVDLPEALPADVEGKSATLALKLPPVLRAGASYKRGRLHTAAELRYEGWSVNDQFKVSTNVKVTSPLLSKPLEVGTLYIKNGWKDVFGGRLGAGYDIFTPEKDKFLLQANAGALFETNAVPAERQSVPFVAGNRLGFSAGATVAYKGFGLTVGGMVYVPTTLEITNSTQTMGTASPSDTPVVVGNGTYTSSIKMATVGLSYTGLGSNK